METSSIQACMSNEAPRDDQAFSYVKLFARPKDICTASEKNNQRDDKKENINSEPSSSELAKEDYYMASTDSSASLVKNTDFSAELLLNKVMNSQYKPTSGKTLTIGGRMNASKLDADAVQFEAAAGNVERGGVVVDGAQDTLTELLDLAKQALKVASTTTDTDVIKNVGSTIFNQFSKLTTSTVDGLAFGSTRALDLGLGASSMSVGVATGDILNWATFTGALNSLSAGSTVNTTALDAAIKGLDAAIASEGVKSVVIHNRYDVLNDLAAQYKNASDAQAVTAGGSPSSLLDNLL